MALIDARHRGWLALAVVLGAGATVAYVASHGPGGAPMGSTPSGLAFGIAAAAVMVFAAALNVRKRLPTWRIGRAESWLKGHVWLGLLVAPLVCYHSGFRFEGTLAVALSLVTLAIVLSGVFGLALQQFLPRLMTERAPGETIYEQIPRVVHLLSVEAYEIVAAVCGRLEEASEECAESDRMRADVRRARRVASYRPAEAPADGSDPLRLFYLEEARPYLRGDGETGALANARDADRMVVGLTTLLPPPLHQSARELGDIVAERRDLAVQRRLHHWLHGWLFVHVPLTMLMLVLLAAHVILALRYAY